MSNSVNSHEKQPRSLEDEHVEEKISTSAGAYNVDEKKLLRKIDLKVTIWGVRPTYAFQADPFAPAVACTLPQVRL